MNADAKRNADELRSQMEELQAEAIDRGVLMTLDDTVFTTNDATLSTSGHRRLNALADFLEQHPERSVASMATRERLIFGMTRRCRSVEPTR